MTDQQMLARAQQVVETTIGLKVKVEKELAQLRDEKQRLVKWLNQKIDEHRSASTVCACLQCGTCFLVLNFVEG